MSHKKQQHIIPESYLKAWSDPATPSGHEPYIWIISADGSSKKRKSPGKSFTETDFYTIRLQDGSRNLVIEDSLAIIEDRFAGLRRDKICADRELDRDDRGLLCVFAAMMRARTKSERRSLTKGFTELHEMTESIEQQFQPGNPAAALQTAAWKDYGHQFTIGHSIEFISDALFHMHLCIFIAAQERRFITSDRPCAWFNPEAYKWPPLLRAPGLAQDRVEITLPISPKHLAYFSWHRLPILARLEGKEKGGGCEYLPIPDGMVDEMNRRARALSDICIISHSAETRPIWFETDEEPEDSWDKQNSSKLREP